MVRQIWREPDFELIKTYNIQKKDDWKDYYPEHDSWIEILKDDLTNHRRIALGIFKIDENLSLVGSVVLKKDTYAPNLEFKNFLIFENRIQEFIQNEDFNNEIESNKNQFVIDYLQRALLAGVHRIASIKGIRRTFTELPIQKKTEISVLVSQGYGIAGTIRPKYREKDDIILFSKEHDPKKLLDPYDCLSISDEIIKSNLIVESESLEDFRIEGDDYFGAILKYFTIGTGDSDYIKNIFELNICILIIDDLLYKRGFTSDVYESNKFKNLRIRFDRLFIFDFLEKSRKQDSFQSLIEKDSKLKYLNFNDISAFSGHDLNFSRRVHNIDSIGGLLVYAEKTQELIDLLNSTKNHNLGIYYHLDGNGKHLHEHSIIVFCDTQAEGQAYLRVWGISYCEGRETIGDIQKEKGKIRTKYVYNFHNKRSLWTDDQLENHLLFCTLDEIYALSLVDFEEVKDDWSMSEILEDFPESSYISKFNEEFHRSFYLSISEVSRICEMTENRKILSVFLNNRNYMIDPIIEVLNTVIEFKNEIGTPLVVEATKLWKKLNANKRKIESEIESPFIESLTESFKDEINSLIEAYKSAVNNPTYSKPDKDQKLKLIFSKLKELLDNIESEKDKIPDYDRIYTLAEKFAGI